MAAHLYRSRRHICRDVMHVQCIQHLAGILLGLLGCGHNIRREGLQVGSSATSGVCSGYSSQRLMLPVQGAAEPERPAVV